MRWIRFAFKYGLGSAVFYWREDRKPENARKVVENGAMVCPACGVVARYYGEAHRCKAWICTCNPGYEGCDGPVCHVAQILEGSREHPS